MGNLEEIIDEKCALAFCCSHAVMKQPISPRDRLVCCDSTRAYAGHAASHAASGVVNWHSDLNLDPLRSWLSFLTLVKCSHAIVSTSTGPEYYVSVLSIVDKVRSGINPTPQKNLNICEHICLRSPLADAHQTAAYAESLIETKEGAPHCFMLKLTLDF